MSERVGIVIALHRVVSEWMWNIPNDRSNEANHVNKVLLLSSRASNEKWCITHVRSRVRNF